MPGLPTNSAKLPTIMPPTNGFVANPGLKVEPGFVDLDALPPIGCESPEDAYVYHGLFLLYCE